MAGPIADNDQIHDLAIQALKEMLAQFGPDHRFPTDAIWEFIPGGVEILSTKKPHQPKRLVKEGYLQDTGAKTKAQSGPRAGSPTTEYRFGHMLVPARTSPAAVTKPPFPGQAGPVAASHSQAIRGIQEAMEAEGYVISSAELANFFLAMTVSPLVILSGISGTGKSLLPRKFAKFTNSRFQPIPVQPQWSDNSDLFGYVPSLASGSFVKGKIIESILDAKRNPDSLSIAVLDEMNLAPVEHGDALRGADLYGADLSGADLRGASLTGADLRGADLYGANLRSANLLCADLGGTNLHEADLGGTNLHEADLDGANLRGACLIDANLGGAALHGADLGRANLRGANLRDANLHDANLGFARLSGADLGGADLRSAVLRGANLHGANLIGAVGIASAGPVGRTRRVVYAVDHGDCIMVQAGCRWDTADAVIAAIETDYALHAAMCEAYVSSVRTMVATLGTARRQVEV